MLKSDLTYLPKFFDRYINLVSESNLIDALRINSPKNLFKDIGKLKTLGDFMYAPEKWTIKQVLQHCIDTEQIMAFRAMCISRGEQINLPGFDENKYAQNINVTDQSVENLLAEFEILRVFNIAMFNKIKKNEMLFDGKANDSLISPLALGFVIVGHAIHHNNIIKERYLNKF